MDRPSSSLLSSRDLEHKLIVASFCKYLDDYAATAPAGGDSSSASENESLIVAADLLRDTAKLDRDTQQRLGQLDLRSSARQYLNNFSTSLAGLKNFYQSYLATIPPASDEVKQRAEQHKERGNQLVAEGKEGEALGEYNKAIELDSKNAVYYCNRAAAYTGLNKFENAIHDCHLSLAADAKYVKAFGRLGVACLKADRLSEAKRATERALELDPSNERYKSNLQLIEERMQQPGADGPASRGGGGATAPPSGGGSADNQRQPNAAAAGGGGGGFGGMNFDPSMISGVLNNPQFMNMAQQVMGDPRIQQALGSVASQFSGAFQQNQQQPPNPQQQSPTSGSAAGGGSAGNTASSAGAGTGGGGGFNINEMLGNLTSQLFRPDSDLTRNIWEAAQQASSGGGAGGGGAQQPQQNQQSDSNTNNASTDSKKDEKKDKKPDGGSSSGGGAGNNTGSSYFS